jgi:uncharacterized protein (DUF58 family)
MSRASLKRARKPVLAVCLRIVLYLIATNAGAGWLYVISAAIGGIGLVSAAVPWWNVRSIQTSRKAPGVGRAGDLFECELEVKNTGWLARHLLELEDRFAGDTGRAVLTRVTSGEPGIVRYTVEAPRRGIYSGGDVAVESGAPFGLFYRHARARVASEMVVYPRTFDVAGLPPSAALDAERADLSEAPTLHPDGVGAIRARGGIPRGNAHRGDPLVRVREDERGGRSRPEAPQRQDHGREDAIDAGRRAAANLRSG